MDSTLNKGAKFLSRRTRVNRGVLPLFILIGGSGAFLGACVYIVPAASSLLQWRDVNLQTTRELGGSDSVVGAQAGFLIDVRLSQQQPQGALRPI